MGSGCPRGTLRSYCTYCGVVRMMVVEAEMVFRKKDSIGEARE